MNQLFTVLAHQYTLPVLECLAKNPKSYRMVGMDLGLKTGTQYYILHKLKKHNLVCFVPNKYNSTQRMYTLTARGRQILDRFAKFNALIEVIN